MCVIFSADKGNQIPLEALQDGTNRNSDGWGVMWFDNGQLVHEKSPKADPLAVYDITKKLTVPAVVHLRLTTHGENSLANTHPFEIIPNRLLMMHNGVVDVSGTSRKRSDTRVMVEDYIQPLIGNKPGRLTNRGMRNFIQSLIGESSNRLVFMDETGKTTYFNKRLGIDWKGIWASNTYGWTLWQDDRDRKRFLTSTQRPTYKDWATGWDSDFRWADKQVQASDDLIMDDAEPVETVNGYMVPAWVGDILDCEDWVEMEQQYTPEYLASALETLRDTYIGAPK